MRRKGVRLLYSERFSIGLIWPTAIGEQNKYFHRRDSVPIEQKRMFVLYHVILCYAMLSEKSCNHLGGGGRVNLNAMLYFTIPCVVQPRLSFASYECFIYPLLCLWSVFLIL